MSEDIHVTGSQHDRVDGFNVNEDVLLLAAVQTICQLRDVQPIHRSVALRTAEAIVWAYTVPPKGWHEAL